MDYGDFKDALRSKNIHIMDENEAGFFGKISGDAYPVDYPAFTYCFGETNDTEKMEFIFIMNYYTLFKTGICLSPQDTSVGNMAIQPPNRKSASVVDFIRCGGWKLPFKFGLKSFKRAVAYENYCKEVMARHCDENTWYLQNLAVSEEHRGKGIGKFMVMALLDYLDGIGGSCYLETHTRNNVAMYEHFGFELVEVGHLPGTGIEHYAMLWKPKKG